MDRSVTTRPTVTPQSANQMLQILQEAAEQNKEVEVDESGRLQTIERGQNAWTSAIIKFFRAPMAPAEALFRQMVEEAEATLVCGKETATKWVEGQVGNLPTLRTVIDKRDIEPLKKDWAEASFILGRSINLPIHKKREAILAMMADYVPRDLELSPDDGTINELMHPLTADAGLRILESLQTMTGVAFNPDTRLAYQFELDAQRATFIMKHDDGSEQRFDGQKKEIVSAGLRRFSKNDDMLALTLSKMANQASVALLSLEIRREFGTPSGVEPAFQSSDQADQAGHTSVRYIMDRDGAGNILLTVSFHRRGHFLYLPERDKSIPINRWTGWEQPAGPENYAEFYEFTAGFAEADLRMGRIAPHIHTPPKGGYRVMIQWSDLGLGLSHP